jgi:hypothetical protein
MLPMQTLRGVDIGDEAMHTSELFGGRRKNGGKGRNK